jgi:formylglycine-generating enzyme required for sulfatase activity
MEFVKIVPGDFVMGCAADDPKCDDEEEPAHRVRITKSFELGKYEVTQAQWQAVMGSKPSNYLDPTRPEVLEVGPPLRSCYFFPASFGYQYFK